MTTILKMREILMMADGAGGPPPPPPQANPGGVGSQGNKGKSFGQPGVNNNKKGIQIGTGRFAQTIYVGTKIKSIALKPLSLSKGEQEKFTKEALTEELLRELAQIYVNKDMQITGLNGFEIPKKSKEAEEAEEARKRKVEEIKHKAEETKKKAGETSGKKGEAEEQKKKEEEERKKKAEEEERKKKAEEEERKKKEADEQKKKEEEAKKKTVEQTKPQQNDTVASSTKTTSNSTGKTQTGIPPIKKADGNKLDSSHKTNTNTNNNGETMTNDTSNNTSTNTTTNENEVENKETQNENEEKEKSNSFYQFLPLMMMGGMGQNNNMMSMMLPMLMMFGDDNKDMNMEKMMPMMMMSMMGGMGQDNNMMGMMFPMLMMFGDDNKDMDMEQMMPIMMMSMMGGMGNNSMDSVQDTGNITNNVVGSNKGYFDDVFLNLFYPLMFGQQTMSSPLSLPTMYQAVQPLMSVPMAYPMIQQNFFNYGMPMIQQPMMMSMAGYPTMPMMQPMMMPMAGYPTMPMMPTMPAMSTMQPPMNMMGMGGNPMMNMMGNPMMGMGGNPMMNMMGNPLMNWAQQMSGMNGLEDAGKKQIAMTWEIMKDQLSPEQQEQMKKMIKICYGISLDDEEEKKKKKEEEEKKKKEEEEKKKKEEEEKKKKEEEEKKKKEDEERKRRENRISEIEREYNKNKQSKIKDKEQIKQDAKRNKSKRDRLKDSFKRHRKQKALLGINNEDISNIKNNMKRIASKTINIDNRHYGHTHKFVKHLYTRASTKVDNKVLFAIQDYIHLEPGEDDVEAICAKHGITVDHGKKHSVYVLKLIADTIGKDALNQIINTKDKGTDALKQCVKKINLKPIFKNYLKGEQTAEATAARFTENVYDYIINSGNEELINSFLKHYNVQRKTTNKKQSKNNKSLVEENSKLDKAIRDVDADNKRRLVH